MTVLRDLCETLVISEGVYNEAATWAVGKPGVDQIRQVVSEGGFRWYP